MSTKRKRLRRQIEAEANQFIDKVYGEYIENDVATQGKPELRRKLRLMFREHLFFQIEVEGAADLAEFDSILDKMERSLKRRIQEMSLQLEAAKLRQSERAAAIAEWKSQSLKVLECLEECLEARDAIMVGLRIGYKAFSEELSKDGIKIPDFDSLNWGIPDSKKRSLLKVDENILKAEKILTRKKPTADPFAKFRQWQISRKQLIRLSWRRKKRLELQKEIFLSYLVEFYSAFITHTISESAPSETSELDE